MENIKENKPSFRLGTREKAIISVVLFVGIFIAILIWGSFIGEDNLYVDLPNKFKSPSIEHIFGTDWVGRDMLTRTIKGLSLSMKIGLIATFVSTIFAVVLGVIGPTFGQKVDAAITWLIDLVLSVPHTLIVILVSIAMGGGAKGIVVGVAVTHWTSLTRVIRAEVMQIMSSDYIKISKSFGKSNYYIAKEHILPHVIPLIIVNSVVIFPHAILHEASVTFLGFGLPPHEPAIGVILSESMKYLTSGQWWLAFFPGVSLILISMMVDRIGKNLEKIVNPKTAYK